MKNLNNGIITGCSDCPFCQMNDMDSGYSCNIKEYPKNYIEESKKYQPITPDWCPIKIKPYTVRYE